MKEFTTDVEMLDKFQCDEIVHFSGAFPIPNRIVSVTEFAQCESPADCNKKARSYRGLSRTSQWDCMPSVADATAAKSPTTSVAQREWQQQQCQVFAGRRISLCLTTTPTTLEGQSGLLLDEVADVAPVVNAHDRTGSAKHMSA